MSENGRLALLQVFLRRSIAEHTVINVSSIFILSTTEQFFVKIQYDIGPLLIGHLFKYYELRYPRKKSKKIEWIF